MEYSKRQDVIIVNGPGNDTEKSRQQKPGGASPGNKYALKHGLHHYKRMLSGDGLKRSTALYHALAEKEQELVRVLGGDPSPQEQAIIADAIKNMLYIASLDNYLMGLKSIVRKGKAHPVLAIRTQLAAHLRENLKTIGLKRVAKNLTLHEILQSDENTRGNGKAEDETGKSQEEPQEG